MSFANNNNERIPGPIQGNALNGLCEKACLQVKKVFDACMRQTTEENVSVTLTDLAPENPTFPLTFVSGKSTTSRGIISNLYIDPIDDRPNMSRLRATIGLPIEIAFTDSNGVAGSGTAIISVPVDIVIGTPEPAIIPYEVVAIVGAVIPDGTYADGTTFNVTACITIVIKTETEVELLVPTYGYCYIPPCQEFSQDVCTGFFELPLFPGANTNT